MSDAAVTRAAAPLLERPLIADSLRYAVSKVVPGVTGLAAVVIFLRLAGSEQYGRFALAFAIASAAASFFTGWLGQAVLRDQEHLDASAAGQRVVRRALLLSLAAGALLLVALWLAGWPGRAEFGGADMLLVLLLYAALACFTLRVAVLQARLSAGVVMQASVAQGVLALLAPLVLLIAWQRSAHALMLGAAVAYAVAALLTVRSPAAGSHEARSGGELLRQAWQYGWPLSFWFASIALFQVADRYLLQRYFDFAAVGSYAALFDIIVRGVALALFPLTMAAHPRIMRLWNSGARADAVVLLRRTAAAQATLFAAGAALFLLLLRPLGALLPDVALRPGTAVPLLLAAFTWQMAFLAHKPLELARRTGVMLVGAAGALALHIAALVWLLPVHGVAAAAWSYLAAGATYVAFCLMAGARHQPVATAHG